MSIETGGDYSMGIDIEYIIKEVRKIQTLADLLISHTEQEYGEIGLLISDISHPLLQKLQDENIQKS